MARYRPCPRDRLGGLASLCLPYIDLLLYAFLSYIWQNKPNSPALAPSEKRRRQMLDCDAGALADQLRDALAVAVIDVALVAQQAHGPT